MLRPIGFDRSEIENAVKSPSKLGVRFENAETPTLWIYHDIGGDEQQSTEDVVRWIASQSSRKRILVRINSYGGVLHDGLAIYNALREHGHVVTRVDGVAASAAGIIALAGRPTQISSSASIFLHRAYAAAIGNAKVFADMAKMLSKSDNEIAKIVASKTGRSVEEAFAWLDGDVDGTWFNSDEALALNLADVVIGDETPQESSEEEEPEEQESAQNVEAHAGIEVQAEANPHRDEPEEKSESGDSQCLEADAQPSMEKEAAAKGGPHARMRILQALYQSLKKGVTG